MSSSPRFDDVEWIAHTETVGVRINTLGPEQATPWHFHTEVSDHLFCLDTPVFVAMRDPEETVALHPGQRLRIAPRRVHRVLNPGASPARYLLVQATGKYDFNAVE